MRLQVFEGKINNQDAFLDVYQGYTNFLSKKFVYSDINIYLCKRKIKQRRQKGYGIPTTRQAVGILYLLSPQEILI
jgi:hypothetical protein